MGTNELHPHFVIVSKFDDGQTSFDNKGKTYRTQVVFTTRNGTT
jgi:hypothetical protein